MSRTARAISGDRSGTKLNGAALADLRTRFEENEMRLAFAVSVAVALSLPFVTLARADDVVIKKDEPSTTVIKKKEEPRLLPVPHEEHKTIIKKGHED